MMGKKRKAERKAVAPAGLPRAMSLSMDSPDLLEFIRGGAGSVSVEAALENSAVLRCVDLISASIGMLPLGLMRRAADGTMAAAEGHPLHRLLAWRPNDWQTPFEFKQLMQGWALADGNAYALPIRSMGRVVALQPIEPGRVSVEQRPDWSLVYKIATAAGVRELGARDVFHLRGLSRDGVRGISRVKKAAAIIQTSLAAQRAAERLFRQGVMAGGALTHPGRLGPEAVGHLRDALDGRYTGADAAGRWMILEEGMKAEIFASTAEASQLAETRAAQVEEIARVFGVPRPLLMMDDTSWGSGVEQLAILFVRFGLAPWFRAWEEAIRRTLIDEAEWPTIAADFDERELLRGTLSDQATFFAKALGSGGHPAWMTQNEVREQSGLGMREDGEGLKQASPAPQEKGSDG
ncbi:MAG: phage portal protein [Gemmatimonadales bacterium]|nr:phage portal protein [Gemmatimonadales bacterium]